MQTGGTGCIGMACIDRDQFVTFQFEFTVLKRLCNCKTFRDLPRKQLMPEIIEPRRRELLFHGFDDFGGGDCLGAREPLQKWDQSKEVVSMAMRDIDGGQVLS